MMREAWMKQSHSYGIGKRYNKALLPDKFSAKRGVKFFKSIGYLTCVFVGGKFDEFPSGRTQWA
jgi:hypothetical protein